MKFPRWAIPVVAAFAATGLVLSACGQERPGVKQNTAAKPPAAAPAADAPVPAAAPTALEVASVSKLGKVVTDGDGKTLYRFDNDTARPPSSTCAGACAKAWPPAAAGTGETEVQGVEQSLVGKVKRPDGTWQVTLGGWPLYRFAKDQSPGDVKGQGVGGTWYAASPTGKKATPVKQSNRWKGWTVITAKKDPKLGLILTDGNGRTLYRFDKDTNKPPTTNCFGKCKKAWPPAVFKGWKKVKLEGVSKKVVDFIERKDDGKCQLTINGWPMYYYEQDEQPGDTNGPGRRRGLVGDHPDRREGRRHRLQHRWRLRLGRRLLAAREGEGAEASRVGRGPRTLRAFFMPTRDNVKAAVRGLASRPHSRGRARPSPPRPHGPHRAERAGEPGPTPPQ